jgi:peroxin-1
MPGLEERIDILKAVTGKLNLAPSLLETGPEGENFREIAMRTEGYSGADLQAVAYNAQLEAIHDVLGDNIELGGEGAKTGGDAKKGDNGGGGKENRIPEFTHFRFGDANPTPADASKPIPSSQLTERALVAAKIAALQAMRRKQKQLQHQQRPGSKDEDEADKEGDEERKEPQIQWKHVESSLASTRSSISAQERRRLEGIYREFVVGRNGEMPSGQGGTEIGGRSSLM